MAIDCGACCMEIHIVVHDATTKERNDVSIISVWALKWKFYVESIVKELFSSVKPLA